MRGQREISGKRNNNNDDDEKNLGKDAGLAGRGTSGPYMAERGEGANADKRGHTKKKGGGGGVIGGRRTPRVEGNRGEGTDAINSSFPREGGKAKGPSLRMRAI